MEIEYKKFRVQNKHREKIMEHINESILSEEIKEHQKEARIDHMVYLPGMEALKSDITKQVVEAMEAYDYDSYTAEDVRCALAKRNRTPEDFAALLSPAAEPFIEEMAQCAKVEKENHFGNSVCFLRRSILPIIVKIIVSTAGLTVITVSAGQN